MSAHDLGTMTTGTHAGEMLRAARVQPSGRFVFLWVRELNRRDLCSGSRFRATKQQRTEFERRGFWPLISKPR